MKRAFYSAPTHSFINDNPTRILGELTNHYQFALEDLQKNAWIQQIDILQRLLQPISDSHISFEYSIPRMGKRVDVVILYKGIIFVVEFKVGEKKYPSAAAEQTLDYALDLKNFHEHSHDRFIVPILLCTEAEEVANEAITYEDDIVHLIRANKNNLVNNIQMLVDTILPQANLDADSWIDSIYKPTPTIVQAAQALYEGHTVEEITTYDAEKINLTATSDAINCVIEDSKKYGKKSICFITGVPGAGKTLAGLNIATQRRDIDTGENAVFLSGNGPLVAVLQEALARNQVDNEKMLGKKITKKSALQKTKTFIQIIHHFRDDQIRSDRPPIEKVAIFDEAQRAWTKKQTSDFMQRKKGVADFDMSEPEFLISVFDRHQDWAVVICLIGGGQEINTGEAGLVEWFHALKEKFSHWDVHISNQLTDREYTNGENIYNLINPNKLHVDQNLHLSVSVRSFRSEQLADFVKALLDQDPNAKNIYAQLKDDYPIRLTRDLNVAKKWLKTKARGNESIGLIASSGAYRLKPQGVNVKSKIDPPIWFLNDKDDIRSSHFLEDVATEFDIQGLELDWTCMAWGGNLRYAEQGWKYKKFSGTKWKNIHKSESQQYLINSYRVLLTRARQGMIIFVPDGDENDATRSREFYMPTFNYLIETGISELSGNSPL